MLLLPLVLLPSASTPMAVLSKPVRFSVSAALPVAVLKPPVVLLKSTSLPLAVLRMPVVLFTSASSPTNVLPLVRWQPCWQTRRTVGESAKQPRAGGMRKKPSRKGDQLIDSLKCRVVIFFVFIFLLRLD